MPRLYDYTLRQYLNVLAAKEPVPGGGSAAALVGSVGVALLSMVIQYSFGKSKQKNIDKKLRNLLKKTEKIRKRLLQLVDLDAKAYLKVVQSRKKSPQLKKQALRQARQVPMEVCRLSYQAIQLAPFLVECGNKYLISDVECAAEMLLAAFNSAKVNVEINQ